MGAELPFGVEYQPADSGPFLWQAFNLATVVSDMGAIAAAGFRVIRLGLAWDSFMPDAQGVDRRRLREFDLVLTAARELGLRLIPVLFIQAHGDCVLLPSRSVRRDGARRGVRVLSQGFIEPGGPRDPWTDTLMLELADRWSAVMAAEFSGHPALAAWDLGQDPARVARPRRIADLGAWAALAGGPMRERGDTVQITLGVDDVLVARGVRLSALAAHVDRIDLAVRPAPLRRLGLAEASAYCFVAELAQRLVGEPAVPIGLLVASPSPGDDAEGGEEVAAAGAIDELIQRRVEAGIAGLHASRWRDLGPRLGERPPYDRFPWLLRTGLLGLDGAAKPSLRPWSHAAREDAELPPPSAWPPHLDVESYYANLPESLLDLASGWHREQDDHPGILDSGDA
ncbi:MAG: hypothetical protein WCB85_01230 [Candidatus Dormiibacterota bacterium]